VAATSIALRQTGRVGRLTAEASALWAKFPARPVPVRWEATCSDSAAVLARLLAPPFPLDSATGQHQRRFGLIRLLEWLQAQPGQTWQDRWMSSGVDTGGRADPHWRQVPVAWLKNTGRITSDNTTAHMTLGAGLLQLICGDVIRPSIGWLLTTTSPQNIAAEMARVRDRDGFTALQAIGQASVIGNVTAAGAFARIAFIMAAKGGTVRDITVGDSLELTQISAIEWDQFGRGGKGPYFYQLLHAMGVFPADAPPTVRLFSSMYHGQLTPEQLIDRYDLACRPVRDLLVDYLRERQPAVDYPTLHKLSYSLGRLFWRDLELHHPGIASLHLPAEAAAAWKQRITTKTTRTRTGGGEVTEVTVARLNAFDHLLTVRAFTWTWPSGQPTTRPGGDRGPRHARSATPTSPSTARHAPAANPGWTSAPASASRSFQPCWPRWTPAGRQPPDGCTPPGPPRPASCSPWPDRPCDGQPEPTPQPAGPGRKTPTAASTAT
jgi:hypothetical protein